MHASCLLWLTACLLSALSGRSSTCRKLTLIHKCTCDRLAWLQEAIVSATVIGAGLSSALGGAFSDAFGRRTGLLLGDVLFAIGAILLAAAGNVSTLIFGKVPGHYCALQS